MSVLLQSFRRVIPGVLVSVTVAMAAAFLSDHYGGPVMLFALLLGMAFHFLSQEGRCVEGIEAASRTILRFGVALLGVRITLDQILSLGAGPMLLVAGSVVVTLVFGGLLARLVGLPGRFGILTGGSVAICGASAALAIAAVLPRDAEAERQAIFTVIGVTTLSTLAMILYPILVAVLGLDHGEAGLFLGGTIHDVAQVVGAGYSVSPETGDIATFTKMLRVAMLLPIVSVLALLFRRQSSAPSGRRPVLLPGFLLAFAALVAVNSAGVLPDLLHVGLTELSRWCLITAIAALGMRTSLKTLAQVGWPAIVLIIAETLFLALLVLGIVVFVSG